MNDWRPGITDTANANGNWNSTLTNWSTSPDGTVNTEPWVDYSDVVFTSGLNSPATYTVTRESYAYVNSFTVNANVTLKSTSSSTIYLNNSTPIINVGSGFTFTINTASGSAVSLSDSQGLTKTGDGTLNFTGTGTNSYSGNTKIQGGTLIFNSDGQLGTVPSRPTANNIILSNNAALQNGSTLTLDPNRGIMISSGGGTFRGTNYVTMTIPGVISDDPNAKGQPITHASIATLVLSGANTFTGEFILNNDGGHVVLQNSNALGSPAGGTTVGLSVLHLQGNIDIASEPLTLNNSSGNSAWGLVNDSGNNTWGGPIALSGSCFINSAGGTLTLTNTISTASGTPNLTLRGASNGIITGAVNHSGNLTKNDAGTWTLDAPANAYTGSTTVNAGTLIINGSTVSATTTVNNTGTLGGTGSLHAVTVANGGAISPGLLGSPGTLSMTNLTLNDTSILNFDLGSDSDLLAATGNLTLDGILNVTAGDGFAPGSYTLITYTGTLTDHTLELGNMPDGFSYAISTATAHEVDLIVTGMLGVGLQRPQAVPEPATLVLLLPSLLILSQKRRKPTT